MDYQLDINDNEILDFLTDSNNFTKENLLDNIDKDTTDEKKLVKLLPSIIANMQKKNKIEFLIKLFDILYLNKHDDLVLINLKKISKSIIKYFTNSKYNTNFPRNLFTNNFLEFIISEKNYFNNYRGLNFSILSLLLHSKKTVDYFNITIMPDYIESYTIFIEKLYNNLNREILSYTNMSSSIVTRSLNIITLVSDYMETLDEEYNKVEEKSKMLIEKTLKLFMLIYSSTCETISLNKESKKIYQYISSRLSFNNNYNPILKQIDEDISKHLKTINILRLNKDLSNLIIDKLENFNLSDNSNENYEDLIRILPYTMNNELFIGNNYTNYLQKCAKYITKILDSEHINIHHKCKFILETDKELHKNNIKQLLNLFIAIEPFNPDSGFNDKSKVRNKIIDIIISLDKLNIISNIETDIFNEFITLFTAHIDDIMCKIIKYKKELENKYKYNPNNISQLLFIKYVIYLSLSTKLLIQFSKIEDEKKDKHYFYKQSELLFSIIKYSISENIYQKIIIKKSEPINKFIEVSCSGLLHEIYENIYSYIEVITDKSEFINIIASNKDFYSKDDIIKTLDKYGEIKFTDEKTLKEILEKYMQNIDEKIESLEKEKEKYSCDIPVKFKDPILFQVIRDPIEIPEVKQILDKYTIMNHLTFSETNPFTNKELTKEDLLKYNNQPEVKIRIDKFINEFNIWKSQHKI